MPSPAQYAANLKSAQNIARLRAGLPPDSQLPDNALTYEQRNTYNKILADIIAKNPQSFSATSTGTAENVQQKTYTPLETYTTADKLRDASESVGDTIVDFNDKLNPFSAGNVGGLSKTLKWTLIALAVGAFAVYFGPALFSGGQRLRRAAAGKRSTP